MQNFALRSDFLSGAICGPAIRLVVGSLLLFGLHGCADAPRDDQDSESAPAETNAQAGVNTEFELENNRKSSRFQTELDLETPTLSDASDPDDSAVPRVLFLGTSLTAGFRLSEDEAFPAKVAELLETAGTPIEAVNAGVSGDTSAGGLARLDWLLQGPPDVIVIELGANDGLRGLPVEMTEVNLRSAVAKARDAGARVILAGMQMPPNYGDDYTRDFAGVFPRVARDTDSILIPFLLEGVAARPDLNLPDGIHPNPEGHSEIARRLVPYLEEALR